MRFSRMNDIAAGNSNTKGKKAFKFGVIGKDLFSLPVILSAQGILRFLRAMLRLVLISLLFASYMELSAPSAIPASDWV